MRRYGKNEIKCLSVPRKRQAAKTAIKFVVGAAFLAATTTVTVKNWQHVLEDVERIRAENGQKILQFQSKTPKLVAPGV